MLNLTLREVTEASDINCERCGDGGWDPASYGEPQPCNDCAGASVNGIAPWSIRGIAHDLRSDWLVMHTEIEVRRETTSLLMLLSFLIGVLVTLGWLSTLTF